MSVIYKSEAGASEIRRRYRQVLDAWPVPAQEVRAPTREGETFVLVCGPVDAPPLLLLHGAGANASAWRDDIASWAQLFRVHLVDLIGEPGLSAPSRPALESDAIAGWLDDVLTGLRISSVAIAAMSLGGWVALDYAIRRPERVNRLALLCPGGIGKQTLGWLPKAMLLRMFGKRGVRRTAGLVTGLDSPQTAAILDEVVLTFAQFKPRTEPLPRFSDEQLRGLEMPVLVLVGERDVMFDSWETAERVRRNIPNATVEILPGTGHAILGQTGTIQSFLTG